MLLPALVMPTYTKLFVDGVIIRNQIDCFRPSWAFSFSRLSFTPLSSLSSRRCFSNSKKAHHHRVGRFIWHVLHLPMSFFTQRSSGEIASRIKLSEDVASVISGPLAEAIVDIFSILVFGVFSLPSTPSSARSSWSPRSPTSFR